MGLGGPLPVGAAVADDGADDDQGRPVLLGLGRLDGGLEPLEVVAVLHAQHAPAVGLEALADVLGEGEGGGAVDRDLVVVVEDLEPAELEMAGEGAGLVRHAFHHLAVAGVDPDPVVEEGEAVAVEALGAHALGDRHADRVADPLAERTGGHLDAAGQLVLRVAGGLGAELAEALQLLDGQAVAGEVEERVEQGRGMAAGEDEAVAVRPVGVVRVVPQEARPDQVGERRLAHRRAGVPRLRRLDHVDGEEPDGVDGELVHVLRVLVGHDERSLHGKAP